MIRRASDRAYQYNIRRPFGILDLDIGTGGGPPAGSIVQLYGPDGVGKNLLMNYLIRNVQLNYGDDARIAYTSFEYGYDKPFGWHCGVSAALSQIEYEEWRADMGREPTPEEIQRVTHQIGDFFIIDVGPDGKNIPAEAKLEAVLKLIGLGSFQLILIDGVGAFQGRGARIKEEKGGVAIRRTLDDDRKVAENARLLTDWLSEAFTQLSFPMASGHMNQTTVVLNNQQRANITTGMNPYQARMAPKTRAGGGYALGHAKAIDIHLKPTGRIKKGDSVIGKSVSWEVTKGKLGTHEGVEGEFDYYYATGIDLAKNIVATGRALKLIYNRGSKIYVPGQEAGMSKEESEQYYAEGPEQEERLAALVQACLNQSGLHARYR